VSLTRTIVEWIASKMAQPRIIFNRTGTSEYLSRYYIIGRPYMDDGSDPIDSTGCPKKDAVFPGYGLYLHKFYRGDEDQALHSHPWIVSLSLILVGGYVEERRGPDDLVRSRVVKPWTLNRIDADDFHRVDLIEKDCWSLFFSGPKTGNSWGFWDRHTGEFLPWREFIAKVRGPSWTGGEKGD
jgi:hypothetical protein